MNTPSIQVESLRNKALGFYAEFTNLKNLPKKYHELEPERKVIANTVGITLGIFLGLGFIFGFKIFLFGSFGYAIKHIVTLLNPEPTPAKKIEFKQTPPPKSTKEHTEKIIELFNEKNFDDLKRDKIMKIIIIKKENDHCPLSAKEDNWTFLKLFENELALVLENDIVNANLYVYQLLNTSVDPITKVAITEKNLTNLCNHFGISDKEKLHSLIRSKKSIQEKVHAFELLTKITSEKHEKHYLISNIYYSIGGFLTIFLGGIGSLFAYGLGAALSKEEITYQDLQILVGSRKLPNKKEPEPHNEECLITYTKISELDPINVITIHNSQFDIRAYLYALLGQKIIWLCPFTKTELTESTKTQICARFGLKIADLEDVCERAKLKVTDFELAVDGTGNKFHERCAWRRTYLLDLIGKKNPELKNELLSHNWKYLQSTELPLFDAFFGLLGAIVRNN